MNIISIKSKYLQELPYDYFDRDTFVKCVYKSMDDIPITFCNFNVVEVYGYDSGGYDGIMISIVEE